MPQSQSAELNDLQVLKSVAKYIFLLSSIPILSFFISKFVIFNGILNSDSTTSNVTSAGIAVLVLHVSLGFYIYKAYHEAEKAPKPVKAD